MTETELIRKRFRNPVLRHWPAAFIQKIHDSPFKGGQPDLFVVLEGVPFVLEAKREGKKVTELQTENLAQAALSGAVAGVLWFMLDGRVKLALNGAHSHRDLVNELAHAIKAELI